MKIIQGPSSLELANKLSAYMGIPLVKTRTKRFPDGEFYFKFDEDIDGEDLLIVQSLYPPQDTHLIELFLMIHIARELGARSVKAFVPYFAYSRQGKRYLDGECLSSIMIAEILQNLGLNALYTINIHDKDLLSKYEIPVFDLTAAGEPAKYFAAKVLRDPFVASPDDRKEAITRARYAASIIDADYTFFSKWRDRHTGEITTFEKKINVQGRDVIIIDDIISTGKTAANAAKLLKKQGARRVFVGVSHALLRGDALNVLEEAGVVEIVGTDSVVNEFAKVSVAPILTEALKGKQKPIV